LQAPLDPQVSGGSIAQTPWGSGAPAAEGVHWPILPGSLQLTQGPLQATLQQTPSAQKPLSHSVPAWQTAPGAFLPHCPSRQGSPAHWLSAVQRE
jgi:hypothetical protein